MKIAVAINQKGSLKDRVAQHFGRAKSFLIFDTKLKRFQICSNPEVGGGEELPPDFLYRKKVEAVIAFGLGPMAYRKFKGYDIKMYKATEGTIEDNLKKIEDNRLKALTKEDIF